MIANEAVELTRAIVTDIRRVVDKADITRQAVELMRSGVPEDAAFYWAVPVAYALQAATSRAGAAPIADAVEALRRIATLHSEGCAECGRLQFESNDDIESLTRFLLHWGRVMQEMREIAETALSPHALSEQRR